MLRRRFADALVAVTASLGAVVMLFTYLSDPAEAVGPSVHGVAADRVAAGAGLVVKVRFSCRKGLSAEVHVKLSQSVGSSNTNLFASDDFLRCKGREQSRTMFTIGPNAWRLSSAAVSVTILECHLVGDDCVFVRSQFSRTVKIGSRAGAGSGLVDVLGVKRVARGAAVLVKIRYICEADPIDPTFVPFDVTVAQVSARKNQPVHQNHPDLRLHCDGTRHPATLPVFAGETPPWRAGKVAVFIPVSDATGSSMRSFHIS